MKSFAGVVVEAKATGRLGPLGIKLYTRLHSTDWHAVRREVVKQSSSPIVRQWMDALLLELRKTNRGMSPASMDAINMVTRTMPARPMAPSGIGEAHGL